MRDIDFKEKLSYFYPRDNSGVDIKPDRDWKVVIVSFWMILFIAIFANLYFMRQLKDNTNIEVVYLKPLALEKDLFDKVAGDIEAKDKYFNELLLKAPVIKDPSL